MEMIAALVVVFATGAACGYGCRGLVSKELAAASARFEAAIAEVKAEAAKLTAKL